jgi:hypothetical protein
MSDTSQLLLAHQLKALQLPTFLREYDKLAQQCAAEGVDHPRYLLRLAPNELWIAGQFACDLFSVAIYQAMDRVAIDRVLLNRSAYALQVGDG